MRKTRLFLVFVIALSFSLVPGCSCFRHNTQKVKLELADVASEERVPGAVVTLAPPEGLVGLFLWISDNGTSCAKRQITEDECVDLYAQLDLSVYNGSYVSSSNDDGEVDLVVDSYTILSNVSDFLAASPSSDQVTGVDFYVRVETDEASEILTVEFTPGNTVSGEFFKVTVVSIGEPIPVEDVD